MVRDSEVVPPTSGAYFATSGFDGLVNLWSADDWQLQKSLSGHTGKAMSVDISSDGKTTVSGGWDRTVRVYSYT